MHAMVAAGPLPITHRNRLSDGQLLLLLRELLLLLLRELLLRELLLQLGVALIVHPPVEVLLGRELRHSTTTQVWMEEFFPR
jgi:hypothetical protein